MEGFKKISKPIKDKIRFLLDWHEDYDGLTEDSKLLLQYIQTFIDTMNALLSGIDDTNDYQKIAWSFHNNDNENISKIFALIERITSSDESDLELPKIERDKKGKKIIAYLAEINEFIKSKLKYSISNYQLLLMKCPNDIDNFFPESSMRINKIEDLLNTEKSELETELNKYINKSQSKLT